MDYVRRSYSSPNKVIPLTPQHGGDRTSVSFNKDSVMAAQSPPPVPSTRPSSTQAKVRPAVPQRSDALKRPPSTNNVALPELLQVSSKMREVGASKRASLDGGGNSLTLRNELIVPLSHLEETSPAWPRGGVDSASFRPLAVPAPPALPPVKRNLPLVPPPSTTPPPVPVETVAVAVAAVAIEEAVVSIVEEPIVVVVAVEEEERPVVVVAAVSAPEEPVHVALEEKHTVVVVTTAVEEPAVVEPTPVEAVPVVVEAEPVAVEAVPVVVEEPVVVDTTPVVVETIPVVVETTPVVVETIPVVVETIPVAVEAMPVVVEEPVVDTTPVVVDTTPVVVVEPIAIETAIAVMEVPLPSPPRRASTAASAEQSGRKNPRPLPPRPQLAERNARSASVPMVASGNHDNDDEGHSSKPRSASVPTVTRQAMKKPREPLPPGAAMFDVVTGKRRSSTTVLQVALFLMQDEATFTIPRDHITDALNWTAVGDEENNVFSCENTQGVEFGKIQERFAQKRHTVRQSFVAKAKKNELHAVTITRMFRGWFVRHKMQSYRWVKASIQLAIRSRNSAKVLLALNCSYQLGKQFVRPEHEHQLALHTLDTIREEQAVRKKLVELSELDCKLLSSRSGEDKLVKKFASVAERVQRCQAIDRFAFQDELSVKAMTLFRLMQNRMEIRASLKRAIETNSKHELLKALKEFEMEHFGCWQAPVVAVVVAPVVTTTNTKDDFKEHRVARDLLVRILHEEPVLRDLLAATCGEEIEVLEEQIASGAREMSFTPSPFALHTLDLASAVLDLRRALHRAKKTHLWLVCEKQVNEVKLKLRLVWDKNQDFQPLLAVLGEEMTALSSELDSKVGVADLLDSLRDSLTRCDVEDLQNVLRKSEKLGLFDRTADMEMQLLIKNAQETVQACMETHTKLAKALEGCNRDPVLLQQVADQVEHVVKSGTTDALLVLECRRLVQLAATELGPLLAKAYDEVPDRLELQQVMDRVRTIERLGGMEALQPIDDLLALDEGKLCQEQLRAATRLGRSERKIHLTMRYRSLHLEQHAHMFRLDRFPDLREAKDFFEPKSASATTAVAARIFSTHRASVSTSRMLSWSRTGISTPLTKTCARDAKLKKLAVAANRTILAYCGDLVEMDLKSEFGGDVCFALHELLVCALKREAELRDELFLQTIKHLTENPRCNSRTRAWNVLALLLVSFPPSTTLDLFLELFLRNHASLADLESLLQKLHQSNFGGERSMAPTMQEIKLRQNDGGSVEGL
ncbi:hypothetical protein BASA81_013755 [Batrachochytrium salamandrivorans]|nr:hypothetical protein BASA81_013755 [Batrachochytrium salamandrivorans]